jgi:hypothetical protein
MSFPYTPNIQDEKLESLQTQYEYLHILRLRHLQWMSSTENPEIHDLHQQAADLIEDVTDYYGRLLEAVQHKDEE